MNPLFFLILIGQPVVPELLAPSDLPTPATRPVVVPLDYDTISLGMYLGNSLGFELVARYDTTSINGRAHVNFCDRKDHFCGSQQQGSVDMIYSLNRMQLGLESHGVEYYSQALSQQDENGRNYVTASLNGLVQKKKYLTGGETGAYTSRMTGDNHWGAWIGSRFFTETPWIRMLYRLSGRYDLDHVSVIADAYGQKTFGSFLITPRAQIRYPFGASIGSTVLALLGRITLGLDGDFRRFTPVVLDSFLTGPVIAGIQEQAVPWTVTDRLAFGFGYSGLGAEFFLETGDKYYWEIEKDSIPLLTSSQCFFSGINLRFRLEQKNVSNYGTARVLFTPPGEIWVPQWELSDSLTLYQDQWGSFITITAGGERFLENYQDEAYALIGLGIYYLREPFRVSLRVDDLLDRRPLRWPVLPDAGRRVCLEVGLFSSRW